MTEPRKCVECSFQESDVDGMLVCHGHGEKIVHCDDPMCPIGQAYAESVKTVGFLLDEQGQAPTRRDVFIAAAMKNVSFAGGKKFMIDSADAFVEIADAVLKAADK